MGIWWAVWSLNEIAQGRRGVELPSPDLRWVYDVIGAVRREAQMMEQAEEDAEREALIRRMQSGH